MATETPPDNNARTRVVDSGAPLALANGTLLGRYRIDGVLGQGGFGITYRATDTALNRVVAIKEYLPSDVAIRIDGSTVIPRSRTDANDYDWGLKRFLDEAKTLAQHEAVPNVVRVYDFVEANGTAYMVMALVEGDNLSAILRQRGTLNEQELRAIVLPLLDGLEQLHEAGLIHRDIKPANIILRAGRGPTLIDFGAAREGLGRKSRSVTSILTPGYAPFEQYGSAGDQGPWTDIYALAATLYHGIAGKAPPDSVDRIRRDPMVPAVQAGTGRYSEEFLAAIDAGLKVDERERPQNATQWRDLFGGLVAPTITTPPVSISQPQPISQPAPSVRPSIEPAPPLAARAGSRGKAMMVAGVAVVLIGGGVAAALSMGGSSATPAAPQAPKVDSANVQLAAAEKERAEAERRRTAELEKRLADEEARRKAAEESQAKVLAEAEKRRQAEEESRRKAAEEAKLKAEAEAREKAEAENRRRIEEETRKKVEAEFKVRAEEEAKKRKIEEDARSKVEEARLKAEEAKRKVEEARQKVEQKTGANSQVAAAPAPSAPSVEPAAYVAQHWNVMAPQVETALRNRGVIADAVTGSPIRFNRIGGYRVVSVTATTITVMVEFSYGRANTSGGGNMSLNIVSERATFRNEAPHFSLIGIQNTGATSAASAPQAEQQISTAAAQPVPEDPSAYIAQHWPAMRSQVERALTARGMITDTVSNTPMRLQSVNGYQLVSVTPSTVTLRVNYTNVRAVMGSGNMTGNSAINNETATFQNQPPNFPLVSIK